jgi:lipoyl(octanoyl) transferase
LTYSVIAPLDEPRVAGGVLESYSRLSQALLNALIRLGLPARADKEYTLTDDVQANGPVCFEVPSNYEITAAGKKLIGSAQARRKNGVLQHGSLPLHGDLTRITRVLQYHDEITRLKAAERLLAHATTLEMLGYVIRWETCAEAFAAAFCETLNLVLHEEELSPQELQRASELVEQKYNHPSWNDRM